MAAAGPDGCGVGGVGYCGRGPDAVLRCDPGLKQDGREWGMGLA